MSTVRKRIKLTKQSVDAAKPRENAYFVWDAQLMGFGVRVSPAGRKTYIVQYRLSGRQRRRKLGIHGPMAPDRARTEALRWLGKVSDGEDPAASLELDRKSVTVAEFCDRYIVDAEAGRIRTRFGAPKKASTLAIDKGRVERHIKPLLGKRLVKDLKRHDIESFLADVESGKTRADTKTGKRGRAIVKGGPTAARRTVELLGAVMSYAVRLEIRPDNPVNGVKGRPPAPRQRYLSTDEYAALGKALEVARKTDGASAAVNALYALALTGARRNEIIALRWTAIDEQQQCLRLTDTKTGASVRPIGAAALTALQSIPAKEKNPHVFPGTVEGEHYKGLPRAVRQIRKQAGLPDFTPHVLRHSFATVAAELGYHEFTIAALLGHRAASVTARYSHAVDRVVIAAADHVARVIKKRMGGKRKSTN